MPDRVTHTNNTPTPYTPEGAQAGMCFAEEPSAPVVDVFEGDACYPEDLPSAADRQGSPATTDAKRGSARTDFAPRADAGVTSSGDSVYANASMLRGRDPQTGVEADLMRASARAGAQTDVSAGMASVGVSSENGGKSARLDVMTAQAGSGIRNPDGSTGFNVGATATAVGVEGTLESGGWSATAGISISKGFAASIGTRDQDRDGAGELCVRVSGGVGLVGATLGVCAENPLPDLYRLWGKLWDKVF